MVANRAGGCSGDVSVNPPAVSFSRPNEINGPDVLTSEQLAAHLSRLGYIDAGTDQAARFIETVGYQHLKLYLPKSGVKSLRAAHNAMLTDMEFQRILLEYIGLFEIAFRARYARNLLLIRDISALVDRRGASAIKSGIPFNWESLVANVEKSCGVTVEFNQRHA